jgi:2-keto-4-pentenoate hydratase
MEPVLGRQGSSRGAAGAFRSLDPDVEDAPWPGDAPTVLSPEVIESAAGRLVEAAETRRPCASLRDLIDPDDVAGAYAVQAAVNRTRVSAGAQVVGRKIGLTSEAVQRQLGVGQPDFGFLFDDMRYDRLPPVVDDRLLQPRIEAEIAFVLGADLADGDLDLDQVTRAVDHAVVALEICDSRVQDWNITFADTVADNASAGGFVLGSVPHSLPRFKPIGAKMRMTVTGQPDSVGTGADCLGDPLLALQWLAQSAREFGDPLTAGQVILSGALGPMRPVAPGDLVEATISGLGSLAITIGGDST